VLFQHLQHLDVDATLRPRLDWLGDVSAPHLVWVGGLAGGWAHEWASGCVRRSMSKWVKDWVKIRSGEKVPRAHDCWTAAQKVRQANDCRQGIFQQHRKPHPLLTLIPSGLRAAATSSSHMRLCEAQRKHATFTTTSNSAESTAQP
jgi:hypothetical protein